MTKNEAIAHALCDHLSTGSPLPPWDDLIREATERVREQARRERIAEALELPEIARVVFAARVVLDGGGTEALDELRAAVAIAEEGGV